MPFLPNIRLNCKRSSSLNKKNKELSEMENSRNLRKKKHFENSLMGYLNINGVRNKIVDLREIANTINRCEPLCNFIIT